MSRRSQRKKQPTLERAAPISLPGGAFYVPAGSQQSTYGQTFYGGKASIPVGQQTLFSPGQPLDTVQGVNPGGYPVQFRFPLAYNSFPVDRSLGDSEIPPFQQLRSLAKICSGITLCERVWLDLVSGMGIKISLKPLYVSLGADEKNYQTELSYFRAFFEKPDGKRDIHTWLRMAIKEQTQIDELYIYKNRTRAGRLLGLKIVDGSTVKPLLDDWGDIPEYDSKGERYAYQQYPWGLPGTKYSTNMMVHYNESPSAFTPYGFSRIEGVIYIINQIIRKQNKDLKHFTDGNIPQGLLLVPENANWTPDQIDTFEQAWNSLLAGNASQQVRLRFTQPGMKYQPFEQYELNTDFDKFILNYIAAMYGVSMQDLSFTESIHKSSGDSQQNVLYRRTVEPLAKIYARILTESMNNDFEPDLHGDMFEASFTGYEEQDDISSLATAYSTLTGAGVLGLTNAGKLLKLPDDPNAPFIGRMIMTATGPIFLDDVASDKMRNAQMQSQLATYQQAVAPPQLKPPQENEPQNPEEKSQEKQSKSENDTSSSSENEPQKTKEKVPSEEDENGPTPADLQQEDEISSHLTSDTDEPFSELERFSAPAYFDETFGFFQRQIPGEQGEPAKKVAIAQIKAQAAKARIQKQAVAAKSKVEHMITTAQSKAQAVAIKAAKVQGKGGAVQAKAQLKTARAQEMAAKKLHKLATTIGSKASLYNALSGRKVSETWTEKDGQEAARIAMDLHNLLYIINSHEDEEDATGLIQQVTQEIHTLQSQKGVSQAMADVLQKLILRVQQQLVRSILDENNEEKEELFEDETHTKQAVEEKRYTISELLQLLQQQVQEKTTDQENGTDLDRSEEVSVVASRNSLGKGAEERTTSGGDSNAEYRRWRQRAIDDIKANRAQRGFTTTLIPESMHRWISEELAACSNVEDVRDVFSQARAMSTQQADLTITNQNDLAKSIHEIFAQVAQRGQKAVVALEG
jgi:hypothetical protein